MKLVNPSSDVDEEKYNAYSKEFIPVVAHYDKHTLITKNGELIQTFQINGINSANISNQLFNLRQIVRSAIKENIEGHDVSFWIHTIRKKVNLDDNAGYNGYFSANIHDIWTRKNFWDDKFVNSLYVSVVHNAPNMAIKNYRSWVNSFYSNIIAEFDEKFHADATGTLTGIVNGIIDSLSEYGATRLGIYQENGEYYSDLMFLYRRIIHLREKKCELPIADLSSALAAHQLTIGIDMMEVISGDRKKFASIISIKEYQEVSAESLDQFLQIPVEIVATEVFYFVPRRQVESHFKQQNYILKVSRDDNLRRLKELDKIIDISGDGENKFCHQKISLMIIGDDPETLKARVKQASCALSKIGICHVQEDIDLEKSFWAQLPGNFNFLHRMIPTILSNTAALASLHNFPTGNQYNPWGRALTLLRTEKGTPYFANFHNSSGSSFAAVLGPKASGRTTIMNFLLSESDKYKPTTLHFVDDLDSAVYVKARGGTWYQQNKNLINPFLIEDTNTNRKTLLEFLKIISNHYFDPLTSQEIKALSLLVDKALALEPEERALSRIIKFLDDIDIYALDVSEAQDLRTHEILESVDKIDNPRINRIDIDASTESVEDGIDFIIAQEESYGADSNDKQDSEDLSRDNHQQYKQVNDGDPTNRPASGDTVSSMSKHSILEQNIDEFGDSEIHLNAQLSDRVTTTDISDMYTTQEVVSQEQSGNLNIPNDEKVVITKHLRERLNRFEEQGEYYQLFERNTAIELKEGSYTTFSLQAYDNLEYREKRYPKDKRLIDQFEYDFNHMRSVKLGIVYAATRLLSNISSTSPKILAIDNLSQILSLAYHGSFINLFKDEMQNNNGVLFVTASLNVIQKLYTGGIKMRWLKSIATKFILPPEMKIRDLDKILSTDQATLTKLYSLTPAARTFVINQDGKSIASELSIGGLQALTQILSAPKYVRDIYVELVKEIGGENLENWVSILYERLDKSNSY